MWKVLPLVVSILLVGTALARDIASEIPAMSCDAMCSDIESRKSTTGHVYTCECHNITSPDGFVMQNARILPSKPTGSAKGAVFLMHGFLTCAMDWVAQPTTEESLPYMLVDAGFDVWLGNSRGNVFSMTNTNMSIDTPAFWEAVDTDNMAAMDVPSILSYVRAASKVSKVHWVGHSQGGGILVLALAKMPSLKDQLGSSVLLAPGVHEKHLQIPLLKLLGDTHFDEFWHNHGFDLKGLETHQYYFPGPKFAHFMEFWTGRTPLCRISTRVCNAIGKILGINVGDPKNLDWRSMANAYKYDSAGSSFHNLMHWAQRMRKDTVAEFDWGKANPQHYNGSKTPPLYDMSRITGTKLALFDGDRDIFVTQRDTNELFAEVPKENWISHTTMKKYAHFDFVWGKDAHERLYPQVIKILSGNVSAEEGVSDVAPEATLPLVV